jgi:hypothetical protein
MLEGVSLDQVRTFIAAAAIPTNRGCWLVIDSYPQPRITGASFLAYICRYELSNPEISGYPLIRDFAPGNAIGECCLPTPVAQSST